MAVPAGSTRVLPPRVGRRTVEGLGLVAVLLVAGVAAALPAPGGESLPLPAPSAPSVGASPAAAPLPWWGGLTYTGENLTGAVAFLANVTIPSGITDRTGFNYTVGIDAPDSVCTWGSAGVENSAGDWRFHYAFTPLGGGAAVNGWPNLLLAPGDTYQLVLVVVPLDGGTLEAAIFNVTAGALYTTAPHTPSAYGSMNDHASGLFAGTSQCDGHPVSLAANLTVRASTLTPATPSHDLFVDSEGVALGAAPFDVLPVPNLWTPTYHGSPPGFAPAQSWTSSDLIVLATFHPTVSVAVTTAPTLQVDAGMSVGVGIAGTSATVPGGPNANTYVESQIEFNGYGSAGPLSFATCHSANGTQLVGGGLPGGQNALTGEYGYTDTNGTPVNSDIYVSYELDPPTNESGNPIDLRCYTDPLLGPGYLDVYALSFLLYDEAGSSVTSLYLDALSSGPREMLGMNAEAWNVTVHRDPWVNLSVSHPTVPVGNSATFTASETGGTPSLTYTWFDNGAVVGACTGTTCPLSWGATGTEHVWVSVTDALGERNVSAHLNETVVPAFTATLAPSGTVYAAVGQSVVLSASAAGGTHGYGYTFLTNRTVGGGTESAGGTYAFSSAVPELVEVWAVVNDSAGDVTVTSHTNVTVLPGVVVTVTPAGLTTDVGINFTLNASATGGSGTGYTYTWSYQGALAPQITCGAGCVFNGTAAGTAEVWVRVSDSDGLVGTSPHVNVTLDPDPTFLAWSFGPSVVDLGVNYTYNVSFGGGTPPFVGYAWLQDLAFVPYCSNANSTCGLLFTALGANNVQVLVVDSVGGLGLSPFLSVEVVPPLQLSLAPLASPVEVGEGVSLSATASAGTGGNSYRFLSSDGPISPLGALSTATWDPTASGVVQVWAGANDSSGDWVVSAHQNVTVLSALTVVVSPSPFATVDEGAALSTTASISGGLSPVTLTWEATGTVSRGACAGSGCNFTWAVPGPEQLWADVEDALGVQVASSHTNVSVVRGALLSVTFVAEPAGAGSLVVNGSSLASGRGVSLETGAYPISAAAASGYTFTGWVALPAANFTFAASGEASTTLALVGNGTVVADFSGSSLVTLTAYVSPSADGTLEVNGSAVASGTALTLRAGVYPVTGTPEAGYDFLAWTTSGGASVASQGTSTFVGVSADGTLTFSVAPYTGIAPTLFQVQLLANPSGTSVTFVLGGTSYPAGETVDEPAGMATLSAELPSGTTFVAWEASGGVALTSTTEVSTSLRVSGNGTLLLEVKSTTTTGLAGLTTTEFDVLLALVGVIFLLVVVGLLRHRAHERQAAPPPPRGSPPPEPSEE